MLWQSHRSWAGKRDVLECQKTGARNGISKPCSGPHDEVAGRCLDFRVIMPVKGIIVRVEHPCVLLDRLSRVRNNRESWYLHL